MARPKRPTPGRRFIHRLANQCGVASIRHWLISIPYTELQERYAFYLEEPWGFDVDNYRMGTLTCVTANVAGGKTKPADFYLPTDKQPSSKQQDDPQHLLDMFKSIEKSNRG